MQTMNKHRETFPGAENMVKNFQEGVRLLSKAQALLERNKGRKLPFVATNSIHPNDLKLTIEQYKKETWQRIVSRLFLKGRLSGHRYKEIEAQIKYGEMPDLTIEAIYNFALGIPSSKPH